MSGSRSIVGKYRGVSCPLAVKCVYGCSIEGGKNEDRKEGSCMQTT